MDQKLWLEVLSRSPCARNRNERRRGVVGEKVSPRKSARAIRLPVNAPREIRIASYSTYSSLAVKSADKSFPGIATRTTKLESLRGIIYNKEAVAWILTG